VANVSHELRTPLTAIQGYLETLLSGALEEPENARRFLEIVLRHSERLGRLLDDLADLSNIELGKVTLRREAVQLDEAVAEVLAIIGPRAERSRVRLGADTPADLPAVFADRDRLSRALRRIVPRGGTAMYDTVAEAVPLAQSGQNRKKALVVISDGNDTNSQTDIAEIKQLIRETEVLVYAIGIDGEAQQTNGGWTSRPPAQLPWPFPGSRRRPTWPSPQPPGGMRGGSRSDDRVNVTALRDMTDDSGGRTEIIRDAHDLNPATVSIADELSKQYYLGYRSLGAKDGRWHSIRVEVRNRAYRVRARRGYIAS